MVCSIAAERLRVFTQPRPFSDMSILFAEGNGPRKRPRTSRARIEARHETLRNCPLRFCASGRPRFRISRLKASAAAELKTSMPSLRVSCH